jgi:hypothetical protein
MIFSENRYPLFGIMLQNPAREQQKGPPRWERPSQMLRLTYSWSMIFPENR